MSMYLLRKHVTECLTLFARDHHLEAHLYVQVRVIRGGDCLELRRYLLSIRERHALEATINAEGWSGLTRCRLRDLEIRRKG